MNTLYIDFETQSGVDLKAFGAVPYVRSPDFRVYLLTYAIDEGPVRAVRWPECGHAPDEILDLLKQGNVRIVAHNASFDRAVFDTWFGRTDPSLWDNTASRAAAIGLGMSLDAALSGLGLRSKDVDGKTTLKKYFKPVGIPEEDFEVLERYAIRDVEALREIDRLLPARDSVNREVEAVIDEQNEKGIRVNRERMARLAGLADQLLLRIQAAGRKFGTYKAGKSEKLIIDSPAQVKLTSYRRYGFALPTTSEKELNEYLHHMGVTMPPEVEELLALHRAKNAKGLAKVKKLAEASELSGGRITSYQVHHGAHTGRPAGRGVNLHNVTRLLKSDGKRTFDEVLKDLEKPENLLTAPRRLGSMLWGALMPDRDDHVIVRSDLSAIEPRIGAWLRRDRRLLELYARADRGEGKDEYTEFGEAMNFPAEILRPAAKVAILAACYGLSQAGYRSQCLQFGLPDPGDEGAKRIIDAYHRRNPSVKAAWYGLVQTCATLVRGPAGYSWETPDRSLVMYTIELNGRKFLLWRLPSGRVKGYANVEPTMNRFGKPTFTFINQFGRREEAIPHKLYENMIQTLAADALFYKIIKIRREVPEARCLLTIYDEGIFSAPPEAADRILEIMREPVPFYSGMPVNADANILTGFHKGDVFKGG